MMSNQILGITMASSKGVRDLGVIFDQDMNLKILNKYARKTKNIQKPKVHDKAADGNIILNAKKY